MSLVLIISILLLTVAAVLSFYRFQSRLRLKAAHREFSSPPRAVNLFADPTSSEAALRIAATEQKTKLLNDVRRALLTRAAEGDRETLFESARFDADEALYGEVLNNLVARVSDDAEQVRALAVFIVQYEDLRANRLLAERLLESWQVASPDKASTTLMLHIAALSDDAEIYNRAVEALLRIRGEDRLREMSAVEVSALVESEYWVLAPHARSSGAGFVLKQTLARLRRELNGEVASRN